MSKGKNIEERIAYIGERVIFLLSVNSTICSIGDFFVVVILESSVKIGMDCTLCVLLVLSNS